MRLALAQFTPTSDPSANLDRLGELVDRAAAGGARLMVAPEGSIVDFLEHPSATTTAAQPLDGPFVTGLLELSRQHRIAIAAGTFVPDDATGKVHNTLVVADRGELRATYRKIHLYDAFSFVESDTVAPGAAAPPVLTFSDDTDNADNTDDAAATDNANNADDAAATETVSIGFATCYDLRFPELFRVLRAAGADVLALASAWVVGPGKEDHWTTLLRARAIENTSYVVASDQVGRKGIGRSLAFDPFGLPLLDLGYATDAVGFVEVHRDRLDEVRRTVPSGDTMRLSVDPQPR